MKNGIPEDKYYTLLEWKDLNLHEWLKFAQANNVERLCDCTVEQLNILYDNYYKNPLK